MSSKPKDKPYLTVLNFSGGKQSSCLLWMILRGNLPKPKNFVVLNADPGMENSETYKYVEMMFDECKKHGIYAATVDGPNLYEDLVNLSNTKKRRIDNPPYWTLDERNKVGRLRQKCTQVYKIAPMDRAIRAILAARFGISMKSKNIGHGIVEKWIGFSYSECHRIKPSKQKYVRFEYPLIDLKMKNEDVIRYFIDNDLPLPPRSVCNACFANGLDTFRDMAANRPDDYEQACKVDDAIRDLTQINVKDKCFVSRTMKPLRELKKDLLSNDEHGDLDDKWSCDSGYCFT
jgi:hypothetical protein